MATGLSRGSLRRKRLAAAIRGVRSDSTTVEGEPDTDPRPDPFVLEIVSEPFTSVDDAHEALARLEGHFRGTADRRAVFLTVYLQVTDAVSKRIGDADFHDPEWVARYLTTFADHYRRALLAFETREHADLPGPWQVAFRQALAGDDLVLQDAFLGINAHVNYDLAYTLREVGIDPDRREKYEDHCAVNDVLASLVDDIQHVLAETYAPGLDDLPEAIDDLGETFSLFSLEEARQIAWDEAVALTDSPLGLRAALSRWFNRTASVGAADFVLSPDASPELLAELRKIEGDQPGPWPPVEEPPAPGQ